MSVISQNTVIPARQAGPGEWRRRVTPDFHFYTPAARVFSARKSAETRRSTVFGSRTMLRRRVTTLSTVPSDTQHRVSSFLIKCRPLPGPRGLAAPRCLRRSLPACASSTAAIFVPREGACPGMPRRFLSLPARTLSQDKAPPPVARLNRWHPPRTSHARSRSQPPTSVLYV